jgi:hypothetical protein
MDFVKGVERLVDPINVGTLHFMQSFNNMIPKKIQKKMVEASGNVTPYMGFVVEPYSYFLCYEVMDMQMAESLLPNGFRLIQTKIFESDEPRYYVIFGCFNAHTSGFWGLRVECYLIAENVETGLLSWVILDYDTNTITYDPKIILSDPNANDSLITTDFNGMLVVDVKNNNERKLVFSSDLKNGLMTELDQRLWVEGNLSIAYSKIKSDEVIAPFSLIFDPKEFQKALRLTKASIKIDANNWFPGLFKSEPSEMVCFPYAQHFLSDSPGHYSVIMDEKHLVDKIDSIDFMKIAVFSTKAFKKAILTGGILALFTNIILVSLLIMS